MPSPHTKRSRKRPQERVNPIEREVVFESYMEGFENEEDKTTRLRDARLAREKSPRKRD